MAEVRWERDRNVQQASPGATPCGKGVEEPQPASPGAKPGASEPPPISPGWAQDDVYRYRTSLHPSRRMTEAELFGAYAKPVQTVREAS
jgi:hypothetical protein